MKKYFIDEETGIVYMARTGGQSPVGTGDISAHLLYDILQELKALNANMEYMSSNIIDVENAITFALKAQTSKR